MKMRSIERVYGVQTDLIQMVRALREHLYKDGKMIELSDKQFHSWVASLCKLSDSFLKSDQNTSESVRSIIELFAAREKIRIMRKEIEPASIEKTVRHCIETMDDISMKAGGGDNGR